MASEIDIANIGLTLLGENTILSLDNETPVQQACNLLWPTAVRDYVLSEHSWNGAVKRGTLAQLAGTPAFDWTYQFTYPADALRILSTDDPSEDWEVGIGSDDTTRVVFTNQSTCKVKYLFRQTNVNLYSPSLQTAMGARFAWMLSIILTAHRGKLQDMQAAYFQLLAVAKAADGQEGSAVVFQSTALTDDVRHGG
jgi:hypothetical protein